MAPRSHQLGRLVVALMFDGSAQVCAKVAATRGLWPAPRRQPPVEEILQWVPRPGRGIGWTLIASVPEKATATAHFSGSFRGGP